MKVGNYKIPFDEEGNLKHYPDSRGGLRWVDNHTFTATMRYEGFARGRSAAYVEWVDTATRQTYCMFLKELDAVLKRKTLAQGATDGTWTFVKRGQNYGLALTDKEVSTHD